MSEKENNLDNVMQKIDSSLTEIQTMANSLTAQLENIPLNEKNYEEVENMYSLLEIIKDVSDELVSQIQQPEIKNIRTMEEQPIKTSLVQISEKGDSPVINPNLSKQEMIGQIQGNVNTLLSALKSILKSVTQLTKAIKDEIVSYPTKQINAVKNAITDRKYNKSMNIVLQELDTQTKILSQTLDTISKANQLLESLDNRKIKPLKKQSILKQLKTNQDKVKNQPARENNPPDLAL